MRIFAARINRNRLLYLQNISEPTATARIKLNSSRKKRSFIKRVSVKINFLFTVYYRGEQALRHKTYGYLTLYKIKLMRYNQLSSIQIKASGERRHCTLLHGGWSIPQLVAQYFETLSRYQEMQTMLLQRSGYIFRRYCMWNCTGLVYEHSTLSSRLVPRITRIPRLTGPISLCLDSFLCVYYFVYIACMCTV